MRAWEAGWRRVAGPAQATRACIVAAVLLVPVFVLPQAADPAVRPKVCLLWVLGLGGLALLIAGGASARLRGRFVALAAVFLVAYAVATLFSSEPALSSTGVYARYGGLLPQCLYVTTAAVLFAAYRDRPERIRHVVLAMAMAAVGVGAYIVLQAARLDWVKWGLTAQESADIARRWAHQPAGTMGNSNFSGAYLGFTLPLLVCLLLSSKAAWRRWWVAGGAGICVVALWLTRSRGGLIAAGVGLVVIALTERRRVTRPLQVAAAGAVLVVTVAVGVTVLQRSRDAPPSQSFSGVLRTGTLVQRTYYWDAAWRVFLSRPLVGHGPDTFYATYLPRRSRHDGAVNGLRIPDEPHNVYLEYAANTGILGIGAYLLVVGWVLRVGLRRLRQLDGAPRLLLTAVVAALCGYLAQAAFSIDAPALAMSGWVLLAAVAVQAAPPTPAREPRRTTTGIAVAVVIAALAATACVPVAADVKAKSGAVETLRRPFSRRAARDLASAIRLDPREAEYRAFAGHAAELRAASARRIDVKRREYQRARVGYERALRRRQDHVRYLLGVATVDTDFAITVDPAAFPVADASWARLARLDPNDWAVQSRYAAMLGTWARARDGDPELLHRAAARLERAIGIQPRLPRLWLRLARLYLALGERDRAVRAIRSAHVLGPTNPAVRDLYGQLTGPGPAPPT